MNHRLNAVLFIATIVGLFGWNLLADDGGAVSAREQRALEEMPAFSFGALFSGRFAERVESYFSDHFLFRNAFIEQGNRLQALRGIPEEDEVTLVVTQGNNMYEPEAEEDGQQSAEGESEAAEIDSVPAAATPAAPEEDGALEGNYLVLGDRAMIVYYYTPQAAKQYAETLNAFAEKISGRYAISEMVVPSSIEFLENEKYKSLSPSQLAAIEEMTRQLDASVRHVPVYDALLKHRDEYVYFRSDHHWTALGAFYAYEAYANAADLQPLPLDAYASEELGEFLGTTYAATLSESVAAEPDRMTVYRPKEPYTYEKLLNGKKTAADLIEEDGEGYPVFLGGDSPLSVVKSEGAGGRKLLVIKDSNANALVPFLAPHYGEIHIMDLRHYDGDVYGYIEAEGIEDILFVNSIDVTSHPGYTRILADKLELEVEEPAYL